MKLILRLEETGMLIFSFCLSIFMGYDWWLFVLFLFVPDISMFGYLLGKKTGSFIYNMVHFKLLAVVIGICGYMLSFPALTFIGIVLFGHSSVDRIFGFGLKYPTSFKKTHLGWIGSGTGTSDK